MPDDDTKRTAEARLGRVLRGKYRLDRVLGIGGMATVYAATHRNSKRFAIKVLHAGIAMPEETRARFLREGYLANQVKHAGAVTVLDEDLAEDGSAFIVMELLEGESLDEIWTHSQRRLPLELVVSVGDALLDVLVAAHARGIVHRDLKPANLFLTSAGELKVLDFGIARLRDDPAVHTTLPGSLVGTPAFMAPEQLVGRGSDVDAQTDLWAVGATLFSLLAGTLVHEGESALHFLADAATRPARSLASVAAEVPRPIADVVDRALRTEKSERWASASEMRAALSSAWLQVTGRPIAPLPKRSVRATDLPAGSGAPSPVSGGGSSDPAAFLPTLDVSQSTGGMNASATARVASGARRTAVTWRARWKRGALACAAIATVAGGVAWRYSARAPRITYCRSVAESADGRRCVAPVPIDVVRGRLDSTVRITEVGGLVAQTERVNFALHASVSVDGADYEGESPAEEILRGDDGKVREIIGRDPHGVIVHWEKWSEGGRRVDLVDIDGVTPRHMEGTRITAIRRDFDSRGFLAQERYFGPAGEPRPDSRGGFGAEYAHDPSGQMTRWAALRATGVPGADDRGIASWRYEHQRLDESDAFSFDLAGARASLGGIWHEQEREVAPGVKEYRFFGEKDEPAANIPLGTYGQRRTWNPTARTTLWAYIDERGSLRPFKGSAICSARHLRDDRGRIVQLELLDCDGNRAADEDGSVEKTTWNDRDEITEVSWLDANGSPMPGIPRITLTHDELGRRIERRSYDETGKLVANKDGLYITRWTWDERGLLLGFAHFDADGKPSTDAHGVSSTRRKYDRLRNLVEEAYFGIDGRPVVNEEAYATRRWTYDAKDDLVLEAFLDATGAPVLFGGEYATRRLVNDDRGAVVEDHYLDTHGEPALGKEGFATAKYVRDPNGDIVEESFFDKHDQPTLRAGGYARKASSYDVRRRPVESSLFDGAGHPVLGSEGWSIERTSYDDRGLVVRIDYFDAAGKPVLIHAGRASIAKTWDVRGNLAEESNLGIDGKPVAADEGFATKKSSHDSRDQLIDELLLGPDGRPATGKDGWSIRKLRYDDRGDRIEEAWFDRDRKAVAPKGSSFVAVQSRFDPRHRLTETSWLDPAGAPATGPDGVATVRYRRDAYGRAVETTYLDGAGVPAVSKEGKLVVRSTYDDAGRLVEERYLDATGAPRAAADGCAVRRTKYDPQGRKVEESCLDARDAPSFSRDGWAARRTLHDARGNDVDVATFGPDGALHADKDGIARRKNRFDERNLLLETRYFDASERPTRDRRGAHVVRFAHDDGGKVTGESAFDENDRPIAAKR